MTAKVAASERDVRALAGIVSDYRADLPAEGLPPSLLSDLTSQIGCDSVLFEGVDSLRQRNWFAQALPDDEYTGDEGLRLVHWKHYWDCEPCSYPDRTGDLRPVITIADFSATAGSRGPEHTGVLWLVVILSSLSTLGFTLLLGHPRRLAALRHGGLRGGR